jgi:uncharacterized protein (DUF849 family)
LNKITVLTKNFAGWDNRIGVEDSLTKKKGSEKTGKRVRKETLLTTT